MENKCIIIIIQLRKHYITEHARLERINDKICYSAKFIDN